MLHIQTFTFNPFSENTYIVSDENKQCWIIDPGAYAPQEETELISFIEKKNLTPNAILNTHGHIDHIFGIQVLSNHFNIPCFLHPDDLPLYLNASTTAAKWGVPFTQPSVSPSTYERFPNQLGNNQLIILHTPGHSPGSISLYFPVNKSVICGDVLFRGSIGRTDLPGGNHETLIQSIQDKLLSLPDETIVYSGHGEATTIGQERRLNPFLRKGPSPLP